MPTQVPLQDPGREFSALRDALEAAAQDVLRSGRYVHGPQHDAFEAEWAAYLAVPWVVGVGNGTDGLEIALRAVGSTTGREVVTAGNAGGYAATAARLTGADVVVADVEPATSLLDVTSAVEACTPRTSAVVVTHLYGRSADVGALRRALPASVAVVEDCAQAAGGRTRDRSGADVACGAAGDLGVFSFYPTKNLGALGDGGAVVGCDAGLGEQVRSLRQYGWGERYRIDVDGGVNSRLDELQAAFLRVKLPHLDTWNRRRRDILAAYADAAAGTRFRLLAPRPGEVPHLAVGRHPDRAGLAGRLAGAGVGTGVHYPVPDHHQAPVRARTGPTGAGQVELACSEVLTVPCFPHLRDAEVEQVCDALRRLA